MKEKKYAILMIMLVMMITPLVSSSSEKMVRTGTVIQKTEYYSVPGSAVSGTWEKGTSLSLMMESEFSFMGEEYYFCEAEDGSFGYINSEMIEFREVETDSSGTLLSEEEQKEVIKDFQTVGQEVTFGHYEQDGDLSNGPEEIQWIVLDSQQGKSLLLSKYLLDAKPYNNENTYVTWENCSLREWLNRDFLDTVFTTKEQTAILTTSVDNSKGQGYDGYGTGSGNNTKDKIFLLSYYEAFDQYFSFDRMCAPTDYAIEQGAFSNRKKVIEGRPAGWWWLRVPDGYPSFVYHDGSHSSNSADLVSVCVRPAFWVNLESDIF